MNPPRKSTLPSPPFYLTHPSTPYCHTCGRMISSKNPTNAVKKGVKHCSARCRRNKPGKLDRKIEDFFVSLLEGRNPGSENVKREEADGIGVGMDRRRVERGSSKSQKNKGGEGRRIVLCSEVEQIVFGSDIWAQESERQDGREGKVEHHNEVLNGTEKGSGEGPAWEEDQQVDLTYLEASDSESGEEETGGVLIDWDQVLGPPGLQREIQQFDMDFCATGPRKKAEDQSPRNDTTILERRRVGQRHAEQREIVRRAARRGVVFGFVVEGDESGKEAEVNAERGKLKGKKKHENEIMGDIGRRPQEKRRKCEAVVKGVVVEPSFAKGEWGVRWRE